MSFLGGLDPFQCDTYPSLPLLNRLPFVSLFRSGMSKKVGEKLVARGPTEMKHVHTNTSSYEHGFKVPCAPKCFDFEFPIIKSTTVLVETRSGT